MNCQHKLNKYEHKITQKKSNRTYKLKYNYYSNLVGGFTSLDIKYINALDDFIKRHNETATGSNHIDSSHGLQHALMVLCHVEKAIDSYNESNSEPISDSDMLKIKLTALLHDVDDSKYFPDNIHYDNAREILSHTGLKKKQIDEIIKMISWVSSSKNGDTIPDECNDKHYLLYPRYADRLEALGIIGLKRTVKYNLHLDPPKPLCFDKDPNPGLTLAELYSDIATEDRYRGYRGNSVSMIDHFYDKLLRLGKYPIRNEYFDAECAKRQKPLEDIVMMYEHAGTITEEQINKYIKKFDIIPTEQCGCQCDIEVNEYMGEHFH